MYQFVSDNIKLQLNYHKETIIIEILLSVLLKVIFYYQMVNYGANELGIIGFGIG